MEKIAKLTEDVLKWIPRAIRIYKLENEGRIDLAYRFARKNGFEAEELRLLKERAFLAMSGYASAIRSYEKTLPMYKALLEKGREGLKEKQ